MMRESPREPDALTSGEPPEPDPASGEQPPAEQLRSPCAPDPGPVRNPYRRYSLDGPQADPEAAYWTQGAKLLPRTVSIHSVLLLTTDPRNDAYYIPPYPKNKDYLEWEIAELADLQSLRDDASAVAGAFAPPAPANALPDDFLNTTRRRISDLIHLDPPPFGAIFNTARPSIRLDNINQQHLRRQAEEVGARQVVTTGRQLGRLFEHDTPGLIHRSALNYLLYRRPELSPPRQARVWMALDLTIYSALLAVWHYKWAADPTSYAYRQRPCEYDQGANFHVLFDNAVDDRGDRDQCARSAPCPSPGTPRSPAYPSAHSAYASAASDILAYFFPDETDSFEMLANNIGTAQLWAGVHWRSDHAAGQRLGRAVARRMIEQMDADCIPCFDDPAYSRPDSTAPDPTSLRQQALQRRITSPCENLENKETLPTQRRDPFTECG